MRFAAKSRTTCLGLLLALTLGGILPDAAKAALYMNTEYGVRADSPPGYFECRSGPDRHDDGLTIMLDAKSIDECGDWFTPGWKGRIIEVFANYNLVNDTDTPAKLAASDCRLAQPAVCGPGPSDLGLIGRKTVSQKIVKPDGAIEYRVLAQLGSTPHDRQPEGVQYSFLLITRPEHEAADLELFRAFLKTARIWQTTPFED